MDQVTRQRCDQLNSLQTSLQVSAGKAPYSQISITLKLAMFLWAPWLTHPLWDQAKGKSGHSFEPGVLRVTS